LDGLSLAPATRLRVMAGPQRDYFSEAAIAAFLASAYRVDAGSDRMGMRLEGPAVRHARGFDITSDAIAPGSIQVPGDGRPIVLLADRQTTGGYPKIATVISADLPALGRLPIGAEVDFAPVLVEEAEWARRELLAQIESIPGRVVPLAPTHESFTPRLYDCNLISGVADARSLSI
jgi:allophanate hydrolase subunit 2